MYPFAKEGEGSEESNMELEGPMGNQVEEKLSVIVNEGLGALS